MEDAHTAVLNLLENDPKAAKEHASKVSFFGVYDGHGGSNVALFAGDNIHRIIAKQDTFKTGNYEQALKDGFLATDRAILNGMLAPVFPEDGGGVTRARVFAAPRHRQPPTHPWPANHNR
jgi:protein phosphatase 2C family protein 2/3